MKCVRPSDDCQPAAEGLHPGWMRGALVLVLLAAARLAAGACLDDCRAGWGGSGPDYDECVVDRGICGNGDVEGDEACDPAAPGARSRAGPGAELVAYVLPCEGRRWQTERWPTVASSTLGVRRPSG